MAFNYVEFVTGSITNRNHIITLESVQSTTTTSDDEQFGEAYMSLFRFDEGLKEYVIRTGSTSGFKGPHGAEALFFDFDNEADLEAAQSEVVTFLRALEANYAIPLEYWSIAFSGSKGFHVSLPMAVCGDLAPSDHFSEIYGAVCLELARGFAFVDRSIYHTNRIIRMPGSLNPKTGLYKTPLTFSELSSLSIDRIKTLSTRSGRIIQARYGLEEVDALPILVELWHKNVIPPHPVPHISIASSVDPLLLPAENGNRNNQAYDMCRFLLSHAFTENQAFSWIQLWNMKNPDPLDPPELLRLVSGAFKRYSNSVNERDHVEIFSIADAEKEYESVADTPEEEKVRFGLTTLDKKIRAFTEGMACSIVAKSSNGKSSLAQWTLVHHARESKRPVIFFSMEMPLALVYERMLQSELGLSGKNIQNAYRTDRRSIQEQSALLQSELKNIHLVRRSGITIEEIAETTTRVEKKTGQHVSLVVIDYLSLIGGKGRDIFEKTMINAIAIKQLAKNLSVPVIFLAQTKKEHSMYDELDENAGKDSGSILEASDFQIALWRKFQTESEAQKDEWINLSLKLTKNRNGPQGVIIKVRMNKLTLLWEEVPTNK